MKTVLVTGIGGNVGQGVLRNIKALDDAIRLIGTNVTSFTGGNHLCDFVYTLPYAYDENYIEKIKEIVFKEKIDLIIPTTDYEGYYLSKNKDSIGCVIAVSSYKTIGVYLDKYETYLYHKKNDLPFAKAFLPSEYTGEFENAIAKPREGRGSRGLLINPEKWNHLLDKEYLIQELHTGKEITVAFYVTKENKLHGYIALDRKLENGATNECHVYLEHQEKIEKMLHKIIEANSFRGAVNLQAILDADGDFNIFEVNCRISGTCSIRHNFGFQDIKYTLQDYLYNKPLDTPEVKAGTAVRILMDVIYPEKETDYNCNSKHYIY